MRRDAIRRAIARHARRRRLALVLSCACDDALAVWEKIADVGVRSAAGSRAARTPSAPSWARRHGALGAAVLLGAGSLLVASALGYDAWAWMVWSRELTHGDLQTAGGPSFKALPVVAVAPLTPFGDVAPVAWLAAMRVSALLALLAAFRAGRRLGDLVAGAAGAVLLAIGPDLFRTAAFGSSEPLLVLLVLLAAIGWLDGRPRAALVLLGAAGLIRPELWPIVLALTAALWVRDRRVDAASLAASTVPPVVWLGLAWLGSGRAFSQVISLHAPARCTACTWAAAFLPSIGLGDGESFTGVLGRLTGAIVLPALVLAVVGVIDAVRRRRGEVLVLAAVALAWVLIVAVMAQMGYPGSRRYLVGPSVLLALLAALGLASALAELRDKRIRAAVAAAIAGVVLVSAYPTIRANARLVSTVRAEQRLHAKLRDAIELAGGRRAVLEAGAAAVNPWLQTALAWDLEVPLRGVQATWDSTHRRPHWHPPTLLFRGPRRLAGPPPALSPRRPVTLLGRAGPWRLLRAVSPREAAAGAVPRVGSIPPLVDRADVYAADAPTGLSPAVRGDPALLYVPNSESDSVYVVSQRTARIVRRLHVSAEPQHVTPSWDLRTLWVTSDKGNRLTPIDPRTGRPGRSARVLDPYNLYFTADGRRAIVVAEAYRRLDFRAPHTMRLRHTLRTPMCPGIDHMDYTANGRRALVSCEFGGRMIVVDLDAERVVKTIELRRGSMPQDVKLSPDGRTFYVADTASNGVWLIDARSMSRIRLQPTGRGAHGLYPSRDRRVLYVSNRAEGSISLISFRTRRPFRKWRIPGGSPDMGGVSASGRVLWLTGRYNAEVYGISTRTGRLLHRIRVGRGPHGMAVWPQPGRYSIGHTGILR